MKRGLWIALEGGDAVGKSTQIPVVATELRKRSGLQVTEIPEFSDSAVGMAISSIILQNRFFSLANKTTPIADILTTFSDLAYLYEKTISPMIQAGGVALSDRSPASPLSYQLTSESGKLEPEREQVFTAMISLISACSLTPDLSVLISVPKEEMIKRMIKRGETHPSTEELIYLAGVQTQLRRAAHLTSKKVIEIEGSQSVDEVTLLITNACWETII